MKKSSALPFVFAFTLFFFLAQIPAACAENTGPVLIKPSLLRSYPHNPLHFTQGLFFHQGRLYESTGGYGQSIVAIKDPQTGKSLLEKKLAREFFGEGSVVAGENLYLLTWKKRKALILNPETLEEKGSFFYGGEGWGLTFDGKHLIRSDGGNSLHFHDLYGKELFSRKIYAEGKPLSFINELEWLPEESLLLANIWHAPLIAVIDVPKGEVLAWLDLRDFIPKELLNHPESVLNGIAISEDGKSLWITGKNWPVMHVFAWPPEGLPAIRH